ncbi:MAG: Hpt domain-containing protein, partial [Pseudarthrobacter sp.]|nr:Hpt domain-containing protein [Pseudarthrobacter sp.]
QRESKMRLAALNAAFPAGGNALIQAAHALKGAAANIGAASVASICAELEELGRTGPSGGDTAMLTRLEAELQRLDAELEAAVREDR